MKRRAFLIHGLGLIVAPISARATVVYSRLQKSLKDLSSRVYLPGSFEFKELKKLINKDLKLKDPQAILQDSQTDVYQQALEVCIKEEAPVRMRSGGHSFEGFSMGTGVVFDTRKWKNFEISEDLSEVTLGSGLTLKEAQDLLHPYKRCIVAGSCPTVGLAGFLLGGGHSLKARKWGLGADRVLSMCVLLASGQRVEVTPLSYSDLYWALLGGGGGNFALVESFTLKTIEFQQEVAFDLFFKPDHAAEVFDFWENQIDKDLNSISAVLILSFQRGQLKTLRVHGVINDVADEITQPLETFEQTPWVKLRAKKSFMSEKLVLRPGNYLRKPSQEIGFKGTSHFAQQKIGREGFNHILKRARKDLSSSGVSLVFEPLGGKISRPEFENSYPHRDSKYIVEFHTVLFRPKNSSQQKKELVCWHKNLEVLFSGRSYVNYPDLSLEDWEQRYYGSSLAKLLEVKKKYDPKHVFNFGPQSLSDYLLNR